MNKNPREWEFWDNEFFGMMNVPDVWRGDFGFALFLQAMTTMLGGGLGMLIVGLPLDLALGLNDYGLFVGMFVGIVIAHTAIRMGKFYKGHSLPVSERYSYSYNYNLKARAREYFSLPPEDRALYPHNIINTLRDPDLTEKQLDSLNRSMSGVYDGIQEREKEKRLLSKREIDIDSLIEQMKDAESSVAVETKTYREFR